MPINVQAWARPLIKMNKVLKKVPVEVPQHRVKSVLVVINPMTNNAKAHWQATLINALNQRGWHYQLYLTSSCLIQNQAFFSDNLKHFSDVIVLGGDGTLHLVVNCMAYSDIPMSFIPCGTGNDFARSWYGKITDEALLTCVLEGQVSAISLGKINQRYFINVAGLGFDGAMLQSSQGRKSYFPKLSYLLQTIEHLWGYQGHMMTICFDKATNANAGEVNDKTAGKVDLTSAALGNHNELTQACERPSFLFAIANGQYFGGGMKIAPHADVRADSLAYCHIQDCRWYDKLINLLRIFSGNHLSAPIVQAGTITHCTVTHCTVTTEGIPMEADGEWLGLSPAVISVCPDALKLRGLVAKT
jgi:diacylglycerol kinase (ATP)